ncbi:MAG: sterol desaturase family protein [Myxococcota bacterium]
MGSPHARGDPRTQCPSRAPPQVEVLIGGDSMLYLLAGLLIGSLADYMLHRFFGHGPGAPRSAAPLISRHTQIHHVVFSSRRGMEAARGETRREHTRLQGRAWLILVMLILVAGGALLPIAGMEAAAMLMTGLLVSLISYDVLHWLHHAPVPGWLGKMPGYRQLRNWHHRHHEEPDAYFAVLLPVWDYIFFTHQGLAEAERRARPAEEAGETESAARSRPTTSMRALLRDTMAAADAEVSDSNADPKSRKEKRKDAKTDAGSTRTRPTTSSQARPQTSPAAPAKTRSGAQARPAGKATGAKWLNVMDADADAGIKVSAVKEEED